MSIKPCSFNSLSDDTEIYLLNMADKYISLKNKNKSNSLDLIARYSDEFCLLINTDIGKDGDIHSKEVIDCLLYFMQSLFDDVNSDIVENLFLNRYHS